MKVVNLDSQAAIGFEETVQKCRENMEKHGVTPDQVCVIVVDRDADGSFFLGMEFNQIPKLEALGVLEYAKASLMAEMMGL